MSDQRIPQMALGLSFAESASFENFIAGENKSLIKLLEQRASDVWISGISGSGKTHLLMAALRHAHRNSSSVAWADCAVGIGETTEATTDLRRAALTAIDNLDEISAGEQQLSLMRVLDHRRQHGMITFVGSTPELPASVIPDLATRLGMLPRYKLRPLDDDGLKTWLSGRAQELGLQLPPETSEWMLTRLSRNPVHLSARLRELDAASLQQQRKLTIPFVRKIVEGR